MKLPEWFEALAKPEISLVANLIFAIAFAIPPVDGADVACVVLSLLCAASDVFALLDPESAEDED